VIAVVVIIVLLLVVVVLTIPVIYIVIKRKKARILLSLTDRKIEVDPDMPFVQASAEGPV
jgi:septation ring formation regulator EzrA